LHPSLRQEVDEPVLAAWMAALRQNLGTYRGLRVIGSHTNIGYDNGVKTIETRGTVKFEKGTAQSEIHYRDDRIVKFNIDSGQLPDDWFEGPEGTELYHQRGKEFLANLLSGKTEAAHQMAHENFRNEISREKLEAMMAKIRAQAGKLESVRYKSERFVAKAKHQVLTVFYNLQCEKGELPGKVVFQFVGLKGHIVAFAVGAAARE
jgi:hypothetical protein